jgi:hypothetical protein
VDIFFNDPTDIPLPPDEVRIRHFEVNPWSDGRRVRVYLEVTPFQKRPNGEISITNAGGDELANISIIETMDPKMEFTLHLRGAELRGPYTVSAYIFYYEESADTSAEDDLPFKGRERTVVDRVTETFDKV